MIYLMLKNNSLKIFNTTCHLLAGRAVDVPRHYPGASHPQPRRFLSRCPDHGSVCAQDFTTPGLIGMYLGLVSWPGDCLDSLRPAVAWGAGLSSRPLP